MSMCVFILTFTTILNHLVRMEGPGQHLCWGEEAMLPRVLGRRFRLLPLQSGPPGTPGHGVDPPQGERGFPEGIELPFLPKASGIPWGR